MRCARTRRVRMERQLGFVDPSVELWAARHLDRCPACAAEARAEERLTAGLAALGDRTAPDVDVVAAVMARIAASDRVERREVAARQLGWASGGAVAGGLALVGMLIWMLPDMGRLFLELGALAAAIREALVPLATPVIVLLEIPTRLLGVLGDLLARLGFALASFRPLAAGAVGIGWAAMIATITLIVGRELVRTRPTWVRKES